MKYYIFNVLTFELIKKISMDQVFLVNIKWTNFEEIFTFFFLFSVNSK
jgi:hypothetical protein